MLVTVSVRRESLFQTRKWRGGVFFRKTPKLCQNSPPSFFDDPGSSSTRKTSKKKRVKYSSHHQNTSSRRRILPTPISSANPSPESQGFRLHFLLYARQSYNLLLLFLNMMLSASAARMGCVKTTLRHVGKRRSLSAVISRPSNATSNSLSGSLRNKVKLQGRVALSSSSDVWRWKSTMAACSESDEDETVVLNKSHGHAEAQKVRSTFSHEEAWMVNLGRDDNNEWLLGPRDPDEWFTGAKPTRCPGKHIYS